MKVSVLCTNKMTVQYDTSASCCILFLFFSLLDVSGSSLRCPSIFGRRSLDQKHSVEDDERACVLVFAQNASRRGQTGGQKGALFRLSGCKASPGDRRKEDGDFQWKWTWSIGRFLFVFSVYSVYLKWNCCTLFFCDFCFFIHHQYNPKNSALNPSGEFLRCKSLTILVHPWSKKKTVVEKKCWWWNYLVSGNAGPQSSRDV